MLQKLLTFWKNLPKWVKILLSGIGTIILSALGTPVWNFLLKPVCVFLINLSYNLFFKLSHDIEIFTYTSIGKMSISSWIVDIKLMFLSLTCAPIVFIATDIYYSNRLNKKHKNYKGNTKVSTFYNKFRKYFFVIVLINIFIFFATLFNDVYSHQKKLDYDNLLTEARPYLSDFQYYSFNAKFRKIKSKTDYDNIIKQLSIIIKENSSTLTN